MKIKEFSWIRENEEKLSEEDHARLTELGVFRMLGTGEVNLPVVEFVKNMKEVTDICQKYEDFA